ncbi:MAG: 16S rRNA (uracil(1498)-N(3))-methyltransferase [Patescibacteria group bacterium]|nr:16S rRNA (uracil(1498)-N(3))-methyltransferase [Patescibacteria group bacterium]
MPYFLASENLLLDRAVRLCGQEADHILLSRRAKVGEQIKVQGPDGKRFIASITDLKKHEVVVVPKEEVAVPPEPDTKTILYQSVVAGGTIDVVLQKATELGAAEVVLFNSQFTATRLLADKFQAKLPRWQKILWEAAKQSERAHPPALRYLPDIGGIAADAATLDKLFVFDVTGQPLPAISYQLQTVGAVIGPEGGLSTDELKLLSALPNSQIVKLGLTLLKADTAAIAALATCQFKNLK